MKPQPMTHRRIGRLLLLTVCLTVTVLALAATWLVVTTPTETQASSHREAPLLAGDPTVDNLDVYAFVSPDAQDTITLIATWIPFEEPGGGPNFYHFDPNARYLINIDSDGDTDADIVYEWDFSGLNISNTSTFLYNTGPIGANYEGDSDFNVRQSYTVTKILDPGGANTTDFQAGPFVMVPDNIGPRSTPNYAAIAANGIRDSADGFPANYKEFTGQRDDPFFVDVRSIFDLAGLRPFNNLHDIPLSVQDGQDVLEGFNAHATAIQVPISELAPGCNNTATNKACVIGVWSTAERNGVQVSRLGNPLVNEVVMSLALKDVFNSVDPSVDATVPAVVARVTDPELAVLANTLYDALDTIDETGRTDLVTVFLTGIPDAPGYPLTTQQTNSASSPSEQLRLNVAMKPTSAVCAGDPLGIFNDDTVDGDDLTAFPNGRRLEDDVTDMALRAVTQGYGPVINGVFGGLVPQFKNLSPNNLLGDGVDANDVACLSSFPYMGTPHAGYENNHGGLFGKFFPVIFK